MNKIGMSIEQEFCEADRGIEVSINMHRQTTIAVEQEKVYVKIAHTRLRFAMFPAPFKDLLI